MSTIAVFGMCLISFWIGEASARWDQRRSKHGGQQSSQNFINSLHALLVRLRDSRRFVGRGLTIQQSMIWEMNGIGNFRVTIEEIEGQTLEPTHQPDTGRE